MRSDCDEKRLRLTSNEEFAYYLYLARLTAEHNHVSITRWSLDKRFRRMLPLKSRRPTTRLELALTGHRNTLVGQPAQESVRMGPWFTAHAISILDPVSMHVLFVVKLESADSHSVHGSASSGPRILPA